MDIRIIRDINNSLMDDIVMIQKVGFSDFYVRYFDFMSKAKSSFHANEATVEDYLHNILDFLTMDEEPFESIQVDIPAYPSIVVKVSSLKKNRKLGPAIVRIMRKTMVNLPQQIQNGSPDFQGIH